MNSPNENLDNFFQDYNLEENNYNFLVLGGNNNEKYSYVERIIESYFAKNNFKQFKSIYDHPDVKYISLPLYDKTSRRIRCVNNKERLSYEFGFFESIDSLRVGAEITIDQIREMSESLNLTPFLKHNIIIINTCDYLNKEASASILKTLEESNSNCIFFLIVENLSSITETIISRCQKIYFEKDEINFDYESHYSYYLSKIPKILVDNIENTNLMNLKHIVANLSMMSAKKYSPLMYSDEWSKIGKPLLDYLLDLFIFLLKGCSFKSDDKRLEIYNGLVSHINIDRKKILNIIKIILRKKSEYINLNVNKKLFFDDLLIVIGGKL